jgi:Tol biopolymer transport system component
MTRAILILAALSIPLAGLCGATSHGVSSDEKAQPRVLSIDDRFALRRVEEPRISPDDTWVAFTVETTDLEKDDSETRIWMAPLSGGEAIIMTVGGSSAGEPRWSPDGRYLSFLSDRAKDTAQVFVLDRRGASDHQRRAGGRGPRVVARRETPGSGDRGPGSGRLI